MFVAVLLYRARGLQGLGSALPKAVVPRSTPQCYTTGGGRPSSGSTRCPCSPRDHTLERTQVCSFMGPPATVTPGWLLVSLSGPEKDRLWSQVRLLTPEHTTTDQREGGADT